MSAELIVAAEEKLDWQEKCQLMEKELLQLQSTFELEENQHFKQILRLLFAFAGFNDEIDQQLSSLRVFLQSKPDNESRKEQINDSISLLLTAKNRSSTVEVRSEDGFIRFLEDLRLPGEMGAEIIGFRRRAGELEDKQLLLNVITDFINYITPIIRSSSNPGGANNPQQLRELLLHLLEWLPINDSQETELQSLKDDVARLNSKTKVSAVLRSITTLIAKQQESLQTELSSITSFLGKIDSELNALEIKLHKLLSTEDDAELLASKFNASMQTEIESIQTEMQECDDIHALKKQIGNKLGTVSEKMDSFLSQSKQTRVEKQTTIRELNKALRLLTRQIAKLKKKLKQEKQKAQIDALTKRPNRHAWNERLEQEFQRWQRYRHTLCLCVIDIDKFKSVNDNYGHAAGDKVLKTVAEQCHAHIRKSDFFARFGGEEFALLLPNTNLEQAVQVVENLRAHIEKCRFHNSGKRVPITISCGVAEFSGADDCASVFQRADKAVYLAKSSGRNCCKSEIDIAAKAA